MTDAKDVDALSHINELVAEEKALREQLQHGEISESEEHKRLRQLEIQLDQCWDLLRQRRALRETGGAARRRGRGLPGLSDGCRPA